MRIALITARFAPECCGVGDYALGLARALGEQGHSVVVFTEPANGARPAGIQVVDVRLRGWRDLRRLLHALLDERPDLVQIEYSGYGWSRWGFAFWLNAAVAALRLEGIAVCVGAHEMYIYFGDHPGQIPISLLQRLHIGLLVCASSSVFLNMPERVRVLRRWLPWKRGQIHYRPNSSTIPVVSLTEAERQELRARRSAAPNDMVVVTFGMFHPAKRYEAVIEAAACAKLERPMKLWLLGDANAAGRSYLAALRERARVRGMESNLFWSGFLETAEVSLHLQAADVFVLPQPDGHLTRSSGFMAAAAHGLPVIAVRNSRNQEEFAHGKNIWLVETGSAGELAAAIETLARDAELRSKLGSNLRRLYRERFDWPRATSRPAEADRVAPAIKAADIASTADPVRKV